MPSPGASASTTQMGVPIPSRRILVRRLHDPRLHQPCRRGDLVFQAKLLTEMGIDGIQDRWRRVHLPGRCALCGWKLRPGRKEPLCPGVYGGLHQTSGFGSGAVQPGGLRWSAYHAYPLGWRSAVPEQRVGQRPAGGAVCCPDRHPVLGLRHRGFAGPLPTLDLYRRATQLACFVPVMQGTPSRMEGSSAS